tara:strand:- start:29365 stop:30897 length:1533 start_codon:yes stop_codon:yes gene_type:complete
MPRAGEIMSMRGMGVPRTAGQAAVRRAMMQQPVTPMIGGKKTPQSEQPVKVAPLARRMSVAYDKLEAQTKSGEGTDSKTIAALGRLVLEFEQVKNSLDGIADAVKRDTKAKVKSVNEEKKLLEQEEDSLVKLRGGFFDLRAKLGLFAGALSIKAAMEGRGGDAIANAGVAVSAFIPEIVNIVSGLVLGKLAFGRGGGGMRAPRGGGKLGMGLGLLGLLGLGGGLMMNNADQRRLNLIRQDQVTQITPSDVRKFDQTTSRFDNILNGLLGGQKAGAQESMDGSSAGSSRAFKTGDKTSVTQVPMGSGAGSLKNLSNEDFRYLAFGVSGEAQRGTDDEFAVAASILNRVASKKYPGSVRDVVMAPGQYEAVTDGSARFEPELQRKLSSPEGQARIADMLEALQGRTDFKGQSQLQNRVPSMDPMFSPRGNFYHYYYETGPGSLRPSDYEMPDFSQFTPQKVSFAPIQVPSNQKPVEVAAAGPVAIAPDIDPDFVDKTRILQNASYLTEGLVG